MDFEFSEEQRALQDLARDLFQRESPPARLRELWQQEEPRDDKVWRTIAEAGARRLFEVEVRLDDATRTNADGRLARFRAVAATALLLNGVAMKLLDLTLDHVKSRKQFEREVGSFQAVKHKLAEMAVEVDASRPAAWYAAYLLANRDPGAVTAARVAKIASNDAAHRANVEALQL